MAHVAGHLACDALAGIVEVVTLGFARDGRADRLAQGLVVGAGAQGRAQVGVVLLAQAHEQLSGAGDAHAVAAFAEIMGQGRDEADLLPGLGQPDITGRAACAFGKIQQRKAFGQPGAQVGQGPVLIQPVLLSHLAHRHHLDEGQVVTLVAAPLHQIEQLAVVDALEGYGVDLDAQAGSGRGPDPLQHLGQAAPPGDCRELVSVQRVQRHVHAPDTDIGQFRRVAGQLAAVGGQGQLVQAVPKVTRHVAEKAHDAATDQRLSSGDTQLAHAQADEGGGQAVKLLQRQEVGLGQELHVFRHAIDASEIAAVGDRHPQIGDGAGKRVDQGRVHVHPPYLGAPDPGHKAGIRGSGGGPCHAGVTNLRQR